MLKKLHKEFQSTKNIYHYKNYSRVFGIPDANRQEMPNTPRTQINGASDLSQQEGRLRMQININGLKNSRKLLQVDS